MYNETIVAYFKIVHRCLYCGSEEDIHINQNAVSDVKVLRNRSSPSSADTMIRLFRESHASNLKTTILSAF
jgi:hypothetical protein